MNLDFDVFFKLQSENRLVVSRIEISFGPAIQKPFSYANVMQRQTVPILRYSMIQKASNPYHADFLIHFHKTCSQSEDDCQSGYELLHSLKGHVTSVNALSFHPTGLFLASGCVKGWVNIWSLHVSVSICIT